jgi:hypothetical protein
LTNLLPKRYYNSMSNELRIKELEQKIANIYADVEGDAHLYGSPTEEQELLALLLQNE